MVRTERRRQPIADRLTQRGQQTWLARQIGYTQNHVCNVLNGHQPASRPFRRACALALGVPESELFHPEEEEVA